MILGDILIRSYCGNGTVYRNDKTAQPLIEPFDEHNLQPASYDLRLGNEFLIPDQRTAIRLNEKPGYIRQQCDTEYPLFPQAFVLATTIEKVSLPNNLVGFVQGRSSIGRLGLFIENAGWIDPGFEGQVTLELFNASANTILLNPGRRICQIVFCYAEGVSQGYSGKYVGQIGVTGSRINRDYEVK